MIPDRRKRSARPYRQLGFTLIELMITATIVLMLVAGLARIISSSVASKAALQAHSERLAESSFALERIVRTVAGSRMLVLPSRDKPGSDWPEHIREQTVPASLPIGSSVLATAALVALLPARMDLDFDGIPDADNDRDGRIDEDLGLDMNFDGAAGVRGVDDGGDGYADNVNWWDDDETNGTGGEDPVDGVDNDGDGLIDEDAGSDMNGDAYPGLAGVDEDADGSVDEGFLYDDDEDGRSDEDWLDTVAYFLQGTTLIERMPVPWDVTGNGSVTGWDYVESPIAEDVTRLRFERIEQAGTVLADITIETTSADGTTLSLNRRVRVGGAL